MQVVGQFNKISDQLKNSIPKLQPGETRWFRMLTGVPNNDPDPIERAKRPIFYGAHQIPTKDRIRDPFTGEFVEIGVVEDFNTNTLVVTKTRLFVPGQDTGLFGLSGDSDEDVELFEYLWICSYFDKNNKGTNKKKQALFTEVVYEEGKKFDDEILLEAQIEDFAKANPEMFNKLTKKINKKKKEVVLET